MTLNRVPNRLSNQKSPYLLQHAYNPVDWYPWGEEAFEKAKSEDKPIFLSIGYSTCHWCHVMERESFEDEEVAQALNENFVAIKVDREERPDIDTIYMAVCQAMTGHGGWPLTVFLTPDKKPFYAGTYFPKKSRHGMPGLLELLDAIHETWVNRKEDLINSGEQIAGILQNQVYRHNPGELAKDILQKGYAYFEQNFDSKYGGFGNAPKFPIPHQLMFLLRYYKLTGEKKALFMVEKTLENMYLGGIYDHIGFGFARYSTDRKWLVPHFEKMLYDNALLAIAYGEAYQVTSNNFYKKAVEEIFTYILRDMTSEEGGFYCAEDADSEGEEGKFYTWIPEEIKAVLGEELGSSFCDAFDITREGNFEGLNIPNLINTGLVEGFDEARQKLFVKREERVHPYKDDKILTSWNGLMIAALAFNSRVFNAPAYARAAERALAFISKHLRKANGRLLARYRDGEAAYLAYVDDYAFLIWGVLELYQTTFKPEYLELALELHQDMLKYFWDKEQGGLYQYGHDAEALLTRPKELYDGALPSGNSVATVNMLRLYYLTGDPSLAEQARAQFRLFGPTVSSSPAGFTYFLMAVFLEQAGSGEITIVGEKDDSITQTMLKTLNSKFLPELGLILKTPDQDEQLLNKLLPTAAERKTIEGKTTAYLCRNFACLPPVTTPEKLEALLNS